MNRYIEIISPGVPSTYIGGSRTRRSSVHHTYLNVSYYCEEPIEVPAFLYDQTMIYDYHISTMEYKFIPQEFSICILYGGEIKHLNDEFKTSFKNSAYLKRVSTQEGFFYVAKGIICDERFNPLVMIVISSPKIGRSMDMIIKRHVVKIFISKKFFDEKCKFICRIRKHYLPLFLKTDCEIVVRDEIGFLPKIEFNGSKSMEAVNNDFKEFLKNVDLDDYTFSRFNNGIIKPFNLIEL